MMTQIDPSERAALDADDECYTPLYGAAIEWSNAREATKTAYQFFQNEATRTVARLMLDALIAIEDQKWAAVISATPALAVAPDPAPDDAEFEQALKKLLAEVVYSTIHGTNSVEAQERQESLIQRILALHRQARHAGLRSMKAWCAAEILTVADNDINRDLYDQWGCGYEQAMERMTEQIDALLAGTEATDE